MNNWSFGRKAVFCVISSVLASSLAGIVFILLNSRIRSLVVAVVTASFICALIFFIVSQLLRDKDTKVRIISNIASVVVGFLVIVSTVIISLAPFIVFPCNHNEAAYDDLTELSKVEDSRISEIRIDDLTGWRISSRSAKPDQKRPVIICFYGNGMNASATSLMIFKDKNGIYGDFNENTDFVCVDYPGYGISGGAPDSDSVKEVALKVYDEVASWETTSEIILFGYSIGTGIATYTASERDAAGLILWAPYANAYDIFNNYLNIFYGPCRLLVRFRMDSDKYIKNVDCPVLILASDADEMVPYQSSRDLFAAADGTAADFVSLSGISHNAFWQDTKALDNTYEFIGEVA